MKRTLLVVVLVLVATLGCSRASHAGGERGKVDAAAHGLVCDGRTDAGPALQAADQLAKIEAADLYLPSGGTCLVRTGFTISTSHTHWRSFGETTIRLDPDASIVEGGGVIGTIVFHDFQDLLLEHITFVGTGDATRACFGRCRGVPRVAMIRVDDVVVHGTIFRDFGQLADGRWRDGMYAQGLSVFGGSNYDVGEGSAFLNNSGDGLAFSDGTTRVRVHDTTLSGNGDSQLVCSIGGNDFKSQSNVMRAPAGNGGPSMVFDRCHDWSARGDVISGGLQGIRVARYADTPDTNHDFTIADEAVSGSSEACISVESSSIVQGTEGHAPGGGHFAVVGNTVSDCPVGIRVNDSENGEIARNIVKSPNVMFRGTLSGNTLVVNEASLNDSAIKPGMTLLARDAGGRCTTPLTQIGSPVDAEGGRATYRTTGPPRSSPAQEFAAAFADGILIIAYQLTAHTGALNVIDNKVFGSQYGLRQVSAGGTIIPSSFKDNALVDQCTPRSAGGPVPPP